MMRNLKRFLKQHWFLLGIVVSICAAHLYPSLGATGGERQKSILNRLIIHYLMHT